LTFVVLALAILVAYSFLARFPTSNVVANSGLLFVVYPMNIEDFHLPMLQSIVLDMVSNFLLEQMGLLRLLFLLHSPFLFPPHKFLAILFLLFSLLFLVPL
jgi:hypothetical protein